MAYSTDKASKRPVWLPPTVSPAIMESIDNPILIYNENYMDKGESMAKKGLPTLPDITLTSQFTSLSLASADKNDNINRSFLLIDGKESLKVSSSDDFIKKLCVDCDARVKVVSIFGNTGDGKSHTLNHLFFGGSEVFPISADQTSCTVGIWAAYDPSTSTICLDTEGLLGSTLEEVRRTRLLLKVLAISDVIIYRTRSERLHRDMFTFLGSASRAYSCHFQSALESINNRSHSASKGLLGPAVIISHETRNTKPLTTSSVESPEDILRTRFLKLNLDIDAFSSLTYVGQQTVELPTQYNMLRRAVISELTNTAVRSPRSPKFVFSTLKALNDKFNGAVKQNVEIFPDEYFTCPAACLSCGARCQSSMGHEGNNPDHKSDTNCRYTHQYENIRYICKTCYKNGKEIIVKPEAFTSNESSWFSIAKYAWSGYVIECPNCGEIYRSRQYWFGNVSPELSAVRTEIHHIWPGMSCYGVSCQNSAQRVLDSVTAITEVVASVSATPTKALGSWVADQIAPKYWKPNPQVKMCAVCCILFTPEMTKHHCRACGEGVCADCSTQNKPVPERGWSYPVRVCDKCASPPADPSLVSTDENEVIARKVTEAVVTTFSSVASILEYPKSMIKETARPSYWTPDSEARECCVCSALFTLVGGKAELHHCRSCGGAVCPSCSTARKPVPHRGWHSPVRVCDSCDKMT